MLANVKAKDSATMRPADTVTEHRRSRWRLGTPVLAVALLAMGVLVAGCGGGAKSPGVADVSTSTTSSAHSSSQAGNGSGESHAASAGALSNGSGGNGPQSGFSISTANPQRALKLSECMRANGVPDFPDPNGQGVIQGTGIDPQSPAFEKAQKACAMDLGSGRAPSPAQQAKAQADALEFSQCMRSHGVADFPDPTFSSGGGIRISIRVRRGSAGSSDLDPNSPIFQKAQKTCQPLMQAGLPGAKAAP
jgi:hypothetical protein